MGNGHGGARPGAGRKRKALAEKILYAGNGHHKITKLKDPGHDDYSDEAATVDELMIKESNRLEGAQLKAKTLSDNEFTDIAGNDMPPVSEYLRKMTKNTNENIAPDIYKKTWQWLKERGCDKFVKKELIEQYSLYIARWVQCEEGINTYGLLAKHPTTGSPIASPYVAMGLNFLKQANVIWGQIFQIVKENSSVVIGERNPADDIMASF